MKYLEKDGIRVQVVTSAQEQIMKRHGYKEVELSRVDKKAKKADKADKAKSEGGR